MDIRRIVFNPQIWFAVGLIGIGTAARLFPSPPNVAPIAAIALLGGATLPMPWAFLVPGVAMLTSDAFIGFYSIPIMASVYLSFFVMVFIGRFLPRKFSPVRLLGASLLGSLLFFIVTNAAVWKFSGMYPQTIDGLISSYYYAIPFFRNTLGGDMFYVFTFFGVYHAVPYILRNIQKRACLLRTTKKLLVYPKR